MFRSLGRIMADGVFKQTPTTDGLVRMFEVEYANEYRNAVRAGVQIDRQYVMEFLKSAN